jgi:aspartyl-tRNA synthetase
MSYDEAVERFGLDTPDLRFALELKDVTEVVKGSGFKVFSDAAKKGGIVKAINAKGSAGFTRKELDELTALAGTYGGKGLAWVKVTEKGWDSPIAKFLTDNEKGSIEKTLEAATGDLLLFSADMPAVVNTFDFVWVTDFPLLEYDVEGKRHSAVHHPFTAPLDEDLGKLDTTPLEAKSKAYDMVLNGIEIGGGSIRIHRRDVQAKMFEKLGISPEAFPKTQKAVCSMSEAPSEVEKSQLDEINIRIKKGK